LPFDLAHYLQSRQALVERRLEEVVTTEPDIPAALREAMRYSLLSPGKRLRPCLVFMACEAVGGKGDSAWPAACAVELVHTYSLIHDDLPAMDDDDLRRGLPTCHKKFGEALAILAGDALLTLAFQVLAQNTPARTAAACSLELAKGAGAGGMVGGQVEDLAWESSTGQQATGQGPGPVFPHVEQPHSIEALENIHAHKTGALFRACLRLGILSAQGDRPGGPDHDLMHRLDRYGHYFGLVFQITDDLLDAVGTAAATGKRTQKDAARGKLTYPGLLGIEESRRRAADLGNKTLDLLAPLGESGQPLAALMHFVLARNR
jgi:geranylgeranyl diphosphate synthase type II